MLSCVGAIAFLLFMYSPVQKQVSPIVKEFDKYNTSNLPQPTWKITSSGKRNYSNYVLILGESARRDFMSLYGFPYETTPHLKSTPKIYFSDFISTAINTTQGVPLLLALSQNGKVQEENNVLTLAKEAGMKTYWLSSEGFSGRFNVAQSRIASFADFKDFSQRNNDFGLIPILRKTLQNKEDKFIVLHTMGSHTNYCDRVRDYDQSIVLGKNKLMDCYANSIKKADEFFHLVKSELDRAGVPYSLIFTSDHAVNFLKGKDGFKEVRNEKIKQSYEIPFVLTSSDMRETTEIHARRSAMNFCKFFASWINVQTNKTDNSYDFFEIKNDVPAVQGYTRIYQYDDLDNGITSFDVLGSKKAAN